MLQTGQVLFRRLSVDFALVLPFKDSSEAAEPRCSTPIASNCRIRLAGLRRRLAGFYGVAKHVANTRDIADARYLRRRRR
jgi:hypothetical protein